MDFPGGALTNIHVTGEYSNIHWRIYTEEPPVADSPPETSISGFAVLRHLSRLKDLELRLRNQDCLVSCYPRRLGLWVFSTTSNFEKLGSLCPNADYDEAGRIRIGSSLLKVSASGSTSSAELVKILSEDPRSNIYSAGPQKPINTPSSSGHVDAHSAAIYAAFISAVSGSISLQLTRCHNALPLGSRTLFTAFEKDGYASPVVNNDAPSSTPALTTLDIQLTSTGKLTTSSQTVAQVGITRLRSPWDQPNEVLDVGPDTDLWLSPNGTIARLVSASPDSSAFPFSNTSGTAVAARLVQWKSSVLEWLQSFGLHASSIEEEAWVEVEVWEPYYAKFYGEKWRLNQEKQSAGPLKRFLWPASYCFRRTKSMPLRCDTRDAFPILGDPLEFAAEWYDMTSSLPADVDPKLHSDPQQEQLKSQGPSPSRSDFPDGIESLSRLAQYQDLQSASLVYPTPPDGPATMAYNHLNSSATFGDDPGFGLSHLQKESAQEAGDQSSSKDPFDPDLTMDFGPSAGLVVGSGLYDTNEDDDLFGEMNERSFGNKGITDADFSFFDDPGFGGVKEDSTPAGNIQATPQTTAEFEDPKVQRDVDSKLTESHSAIELPAEHGDVSQIDPGDTRPKFGEEAALVNDSITPHNGNSQTISPPLSPVEVKKILFPVPDQGDHPGMEGRKQNHYSPVAFDRNIGDWDRKYGSEGKFWFSSSTMDFAADPNDSTSGIPTVGIPSRGGKPKALADASAKPLNDYGTPSSGLKQCLRSSSVSSPDTSDDSDDMASEDGAQPAMFTTLKRKRARSSFESLSPSSEEFAKDPDREVSTEGVDSSTLLGNFLSILSDWSMTGYFSAPQNQALPLLPRNGHQVQIAQLLVDQVAHSSLSHNIDSREAISDFENEAYPLRTSLKGVDIMGEAERLDLKSFVSLQDSGHLPIISDGAMSHQPAQQKKTETGVILKLCPPHLRIRRLKNYLEALPPVVSFWETFGLEPAHGPKDISAYCIHPQNAVESADAFLERIGLLYSNCNLGEHVRGDRSNTFERGLASWDTGPAEVSNYSAMVQSLKSFCEELGTALAKSRTSKENIVIYIINPFSHAAAIADICAAFWQLSQIYAADVDKEQTFQLDELVLQVVPMSFLMSAESIVVPSQAEYLNLALEVYSRCPPKDSGSSTVDSAPPVVLAESLPKGINFKLTSEKLSPLLEGRCLHVACSKSLDQRWMTVAWSNNSGSFQRIMSYCLRFRDSNVSRNIAEVRSEIWAATRDIMDRFQARWRVIIVNTEPVDEEEVDTWTNLAEQHNKTKPVSLELLVLNVNTAPGLSLELPSLPMPVSILNSQPSPVATPSVSGSVPSPDQAANSPTPAGGGSAPPNALTPAEGHLDAESESVLTDVCDESWAVVLSHRLNNSVHLTEFRPSLASGYLFRRRGPTDGDGVFSMNVNLVHTQRPPSSHESLLQDTLKMYRDLATLSRARGTHNVQQNTLPWHIAAAVRGQEILSYVL